MTADHNGWPGEPGVPLNPERDGWHWVLADEEHLIPYEWRPAGVCERGRWGAHWAFDIEAEIDPRTCRYVAPCLTPGQHAAAIAAAREEGRREGREHVIGAAADLIARRDMTCAGCCGPSAKPEEYGGYLDQAKDEIAAAIRALAQGGGDAR